MSDDHTKQYEGLRSRSPKSLMITIYFGNGDYFTETIKVPPTNTNCLYWYKKSIYFQELIARNEFVYADHFPLGKNGGKFSFLRGDKDLLKVRLINFQNEIQGKNKNNYVFSTVKNYVVSANVMIEEFGHLYAGQLTLVDIADWSKTLDITKKTLIEKLRPLRFVLDTAMREGVINKNILRECELEASRKSRFQIEAFTHDEQNAILAQEMDDHLRNMITVWFFTGLRTSEIFGLKWSKFDIKKKTLLIDEAQVAGQQKFSAKTAAGNRQFTLLNRAYDALCDHRASKKIISITSMTTDSFVFLNPQSGRPWQYAGFTKSWARLLEKAGVRYRSPRQIRHTFATMMISLIGEGSLSPLVQAFGHETEGTMRRCYIDRSVVWVDADWSEVNKYLEK